MGKKGKSKRKGGGNARRMKQRRRQRQNAQTNASVDELDGSDVSGLEESQDSILIQLGITTGVDLERIGCTETEEGDQQMMDNIRNEGHGCSETSPKFSACYQLFLNKFNYWLVRNCF